MLGVVLGWLGFVLGHDPIVGNGSLCCESRAVYRLVVVSYRIALLEICLWLLLRLVLVVGCGLCGE